jgi:hypothetical protein
MHPDRKPILTGPETHLHAAGEYESSVTVGGVKALTRSSPWPPTPLPSTARRRWSGPRSAMETRLARSTAICGSSGSPVTAAAPGSRSGPTGQSAPTRHATTWHSRSLWPAARGRVAGRSGFPSNRGEFGCGDDGQGGLSLLRPRLTGAGCGLPAFAAPRGRRGPRGPGRPAGPSPAGRCAAPWRPGWRPRTLSGRSKDSGGEAASFARPAQRARRGHAASLPASDRS